MDLHHVGIATDDLEGMVAQYETVLEVEPVHRERLDGLEVAFLETGSCLLELLEPHQSGTVARFLERRGPGLHHLAFETDDITAALGQAATAGVELVDESPRSGAWGHEVAFVHPAGMGGVLVEFVQHPH